MNTAIQPSTKVFFGGKNRCSGYIKGHTKLIPLDFLKFKDTSFLSEKLYLITQFKIQCQFNCLKVNYYNLILVKACIKKNHVNILYIL